MDSKTSVVLILNEMNCFLFFLSYATETKTTNILVKQKHFPERSRYSETYSC